MSRKAKPGLPAPPIEESRRRTRAEIEQYFAAQDVPPGADPEWFRVARHAIHSGDPADRWRMRDRIIDWLNDESISDTLSRYLFYVMMFAPDLPHAREGKKPTKRLDTELVRPLALAYVLARNRRTTTHPRQGGLEAAARELGMSVKLLERVYASPVCKKALELFLAGEDSLSVKQKLSKPST